MRNAAALSILLVMAALGAQTPADPLAEARRLVAAARWDEAYPLLQRLAAPGGAASSNPETGDLLGQVAMGYLRAERLDPGFEALRAELSFVRQMHGGRDHVEVAKRMGALAAGLEAAGRLDVALPLWTDALAMRRRLTGGLDDPTISTVLIRLGYCLHLMSNHEASLQPFQEALAIDLRLHGETPHADVSVGHEHVGNCLLLLGRAREALPQFEAALASSRLLTSGRDDRRVVLSSYSVGRSLYESGRLEEALAHFEAGLAMCERLAEPTDEPHVARGLGLIGGCLIGMGRPVEALPRLETALAMYRRLRGDADHADLADALAGLANCLQRLGRNDGALGMFEAALAMQRRLHGDRDHLQVAHAEAGLGWCLQQLDRPREALARFDSALAMLERLFGSADHPQVVTALDNVGRALFSSGRAADALPRFEAALAMVRRIHGDGNPREVAGRLINVANCLVALRRPDEAIGSFEAADAGLQRAFGDAAHPDRVVCLGGMARCLRLLQRTEDALRACERCCELIERMRLDVRASSQVRQSFFDELKSGAAFERLQLTAVLAGKPALALHAAERSRGRDLLDLCEQQRFDPLDEAERRARLRGDEPATAAILRVRRDLEECRTQSDRMLFEMTQQPAGAGDGGLHPSWGERAAALQTRQRQLLDEQARLLGDVLPVGRVCTPEEIRAALQEGEVLLEYTIAKGACFVYLLEPKRDIEGITLPGAESVVQRVLGGILQRHSKAQLPSRGRDPSKGPDVVGSAIADSRELFASLVPDAVWQRIRTARRVFVAAHRELHRLPFELLVTDVKEGAPVYWLDSGPPVAYVPSGSALHWMRQRAKDAGDDRTALDVLAVGDPGALVALPEVPANGVYVLGVTAGGEGARVGLLPRDVLLSYDGKPLEDDTTLRDVRAATEAAIEDGKRPRDPIPLGVWRAGESLRLDVKPGPLGLQVARGGARAAQEASSGTGGQLARITRAGDLERLRELPPLLGARAETAAIEAVFTSQRRTKRLLGAEATEPAVFDLAAKAKYLHFACHGIAEEYAGQSLSMLVLAQPPNVLPDDDGLLKLDDLLHRWRGRLSSCRLVVLSACRTNVGPTLRDEAPQALPLGFLFAGAPAVISSLWAVDDESTRILMTDFYGRLLAGETDQLAAFTAAKKALRTKYSDPFHWAPFLYTGSPQ